MKKPQSNGERNKSAPVQLMNSMVLMDLMKLISQVLNYSFFFSDFQIKAVWAFCVFVCYFEEIHWLSLDDTNTKEPTQKNIITSAESLGIKAIANTNLQCEKKRKKKKDVSYKSILYLTLKLKNMLNKNLWNSTRNCDRYCIWKELCDVENLCVKLFAWI